MQSVPMTMLCRFRASQSAGGIIFKLVGNGGLSGWPKISSRIRETYPFPLIIESSRLYGGVKNSAACKAKKGTLAPPKAPPELPENPRRCWKACDKCNTMILSRMLHPELLSVLGRAGHGSRVLIADGNYPVSTHAPASAVRVFLNLRRGLVEVADVLDVLGDTVPIEQAILMATPDGQPPPIHH